MADKNLAALRKLIKKLKVNFKESQKLQTLYHNLYVNKQIYQMEESVWLSKKHIKTKKNLKLEHKYFNPFKILDEVEK